ncbi:MAG: hypothetical protein KGJ21_03320 [Pseudomonadota bacterium]|nr:hypothetical protein [Pseudomonadota bacterium]
MTVEIITRSAEIKLMQALSAIRDESAGWHAVHFHLSGLMDEYKSDYQVKIAINLIHDLLKNDVSIYVIDNGDIVVLSPRLEKTAIGKLIFQLRYLYMDDPLAYTGGGQENPAFSTAYDLKYQWKEFHGICLQRMQVQSRNAPIIEYRAGGRTPEITEEKEKSPDDRKLSPHKLAGIERDLTRADLNKVMRRQPVCAVLPGAGGVRRVFDELYIHIAHLRRMLNSEVDFLSNRWLFKYLTGILDERMIALIGHHPGRYLDSPISLNLNVETLLSPHFAEFNALVSPAARVSIVIEVPVVDVFADMPAFITARLEVQKLGYRVCLDGLTVDSFASINREKLGLDLVKVQWNAGVKDGGASAMAEAVKITGNNRVILCRCDNHAAVEYGQSLGISLFQGRYLDSLLDPTGKVSN